MKTAFNAKFQTATSTSIFRSLSLGLMGLFLAGTSLTSAHAAETNIDSANSPVVIDWPGNHLAVFTMKYNASWKHPTISGYVGSKPDTADSSSQSPNLVLKSFIDGKTGLQDRLQVIQQPCNKTLIFAKDDSYRIRCYDVKSTVKDGVPDGAGMENLNDTIEAITIPGGFQSFSITPLPFTTPAPFLNDPSVTNELYPMLLTYVQNNQIHLERLDYYWSNEKWSWAFKRTQTNFGIIKSNLLNETKISSCLIPSPQGTADFPYKLIVATMASYRGSSTKGTIYAREFRIGTDGLQNTGDNIQTTVVNGNTDLGNTDITKDLIAYVGADGRPAVNALKLNGQPLHYILDNTAPIAAPNYTQWSWDSSYGDYWDNANYKWTPTTNYYASWKNSSPDAWTNHVASQIRNGDPLNQRAGTDVENVRKVFRYALGEGATSTYLRAMREYIFNAHSRPTSYVLQGKLKGLLIGIIEGGPPVPLQNLDSVLPLPNPSTIYGSTTVQLSKDTSVEVSSSTSMGTVASTEGAVGSFAWNVRGEAAFQQFFSNTSSKLTTTSFVANSVLNSPFPGLDVNLARDWSRIGHAFILKHDCETYDYYVTWKNDAPIGGSALFKQAVLLNPNIIDLPFLLSDTKGIAEDQPIIPGRLSSYYRKTSDIYNFPFYSLGDQSIDPLSNTWTSGGGAFYTQEIKSSTSTGHGTTFDLEALVGVNLSYQEIASVKLMAGIHSSGSWSWSGTTGATSSLAPVVSSVPYTSNEYNSTNAKVQQTLQSFTFNTYWLQENRTFAERLKAILSSTGQQAISDRIADGSSPWLVTYGLTDMIRNKDASVNSPLSTRIDDLSIFELANYPWK